MIALRRNVLLFHQAALGDFVVTWPIAMAAARLWPTNRTIYVTTGDRGALAERAIGVEWRDVDPTFPLFSVDGDVPDATRKLLAGATLIVSFVSDGQDAWATNVRRLAGPDVPVICVRPRPERDDEHVMAAHAGQLGESPQLQAAVGQMIRHVAASGAVARRPATTLDVLIHPGSGGVAKCWPLERFVALAGALRASGRSVAFAVGEAERERWPATALDAMRGAATVHAPRSAVELFDLVRTARAYVGNDSGPTHLAAISGVSTLALFGGPATQWRPIGPSVNVIERTPLDALPVDEVAPIVQAMLEQTSGDSVAVRDED